VAENCRSKALLGRPLPTSEMPEPWKYRFSTEPATGPSGATPEKP
jgi:hypothetical protein